MFECLFNGLDPRPLFSLMRFNCFVRWVLCERDGALGEEI